VCLALAAIEMGCGRAGESVPAERRFPLAGTVIDDPDSSGRLTVAHDAVDGFMPAMAMPFETRGLPAGLGKDDRIQAILVVTPDRSWLEGVSVVRSAGAALPARRLPPPDIGTSVPNFRLRNQDDLPITIHGFRGRVMLVAFIYTRCPLPDFCPQLMTQFRAVKRGLQPQPGIRDKVHFLSVTIDPAVDTPAVLQAYGRRAIGGQAPFTHWDLATGSDAEIRAMATFFGLQQQPDSGFISHSLVTAVIGADGRLAALLPPNMWTADEAIAILVDEVQKSRSRGRAEGR